MPDEFIIDDKLAYVRQTLHVPTIWVVSRGWDEGGPYLWRTGEWHNSYDYRCEFRSREDALSCAATYAEPDDAPKAHGVHIPLW